MFDSPIKFGEVILNQRGPILCYHRNLGENIINPVGDLRNGCVVGYRVGYFLAMLKLTIRYHFS